MTTSALSNPIADAPPSSSVTARLRLVTNRDGRPTTDRRAEISGDIERLARALAATVGQEAAEAFCQSLGEKHGQGSASVALRLLDARRSVKGGVAAALRAAGMSDRDYGGQMVGVGRRTFDRELRNLLSREVAE
jgi:hypothetical protein